MNFNSKSVLLVMTSLLAVVFLPSGMVDSSSLAYVGKSVAVEASAAHACPFCAAINATFAEQIDKHEVVVIASLIEPPPELDEDAQEYPKAKFKITQIIKGSEFVQQEMTFLTQLVGSYPVGEQFLVMGVEPPNVFWSTPMKTTDRIVKYLLESQQLPGKGPDRLVFFQEYFEDEESVLAFDAYDEFAVADYQDLIAMKDRIKREQILQWINDPEIRVDRRRLYFTMLGVCGTAEDVGMLEGLIKSGEPEKLAGLDSLVACYLTLKGEAGVPLIEEKFLKNPEVDFVDANAVVSALRFHGTEVSIIPRPRITAAVRLLLDRPNMADMIIPDLARWEDWSVMERLVQMFKETDQDSEWIRVPVITYLRACPKPEAKEFIKELAKIDPDAVRRADFFMGGFIDDDDEDDNLNDERESGVGQQTDQGDKKEADKKEADKKEADKKEADKNEADGKEADGKEADGKEADGKEADGVDPQASAPYSLILPFGVAGEGLEKVSFLADADTVPLKLSNSPDQKTPFGIPQAGKSATDSANSPEVSSHRVQKVPVKQPLDRNTSVDVASPVADPSRELIDDGSNQPSDFSEDQLIFWDFSEKTETSAPSANPLLPPNVSKEDGSSSLAVADGTAGLATGNPPLAVAYTPAPAWMIVLIAISTSVLLFILLWSVVNGWFERLIF